MAKKLIFKENIKKLIHTNNQLMATLADINRSFTPAIAKLLREDSQKLFFTDFLKPISKTLNIPINELYNEVEIFETETSNA